jgi:colanic acid/amylovoran biosynthesis glycosyltransferase
LRVAYLTNQYPKISHTFIRREIHALERLGVEVERFALRGWDAELVDEHDISELRSTRYLLKGGIIPLIGALARELVSQPSRFFKALGAAVTMSRKSIRPLPFHIAYLAHACRLKGWLSKRNVSHLHAHFGTNPAEVARLLHILGGPTYSFTIHGADEADHAPYLHLDKKVKDAKFVAAISFYTRSQLLRNIDVSDWGKVKVIRCGLLEETFAEEGIRRSNTPQFLSIGRFCVEKGQRTLLESFAKVVKDYDHCRLILAGDGELRPLIERTIEELNLQNNVTLTGWVSGSHVRELISKSQIIVQPSLQEGLPVVIMEAMAQGRPVLSTYVAGIPELVVDGETGWLVPAGDVDGLAKAFQRCLETPHEELSRMGHAAFESVKRQHDINGEAEKLAGYFSAAH